MPETSRISSRRWLYGIAAFVVAVAAIVAVALVVDHSRRPDIGPAAEIAAPSPVVDAAPPAGDDGAAPAADTVAAALAEPVADGALGEVTGHVTDVATGSGIWSADPDRTLVPASATKLTTATAALLTLPVDDRVATTVLPGTEPGQLVLDGGGDITLQRTGDSGFFTDAPSIEDLAEQVTGALGGQRVTSVVVDNSVRGGDLFNSTWSTDDIAAGNVAPLGAVMVDAGRLDPTDNYSPRSGTPAADAGRALADALGAPGIPVTVSDEPVETSAAEGATPLGTVRSATLGTRLRDMMLHSDNLLAEAVGREVAAARGKPQTFAGATGAVLETLAEAGVPVDGAVLEDCSGMSEDNRLSARILDGVLALAAGAPAGDDAAGSGDRTAELRLLLDALPVAAADGTLSDRYLTGSGAETAAGRVRAKTGTLDGVNALAGTLTTDSGRVLTFALLSNGSDQDAGRAALDRLAAALRRV
ncbi:D-alanyl-D-alanine carboxypeptidase/D-alanyl-D-alanine-endopeptidase [uncultured Corynebacterium sp.]|uniref:D-alanyl-D-alanine carboxypeptidase/D-alanyl-D-alanine endopeptidase n=1 Tax=uncultured Corynebacterium sp. TaxID=159447 RepID=UPI0025F278C2|nr:D-alanyl-D-alanine carboxypeptidase/D-alanyl-D-alanine-endopeptidase [uncultured Corynebacterium sp.]